MSTIQDVAQKAGVSVSTVYKVLVTVIKRVMKSENVYLRRVMN